MIDLSFYIQKPIILSKETEIGFTRYLLINLNKYFRVLTLNKQQRIITEKANQEFAY
jgi:hypothetical protein